MRAVVFSALLVFLHCPQVPAAEMVWITTDFSTGGMALQTAGQCSATEVGFPIPGDAVVRSWGGYVFIIGRLGYDHITVVQAGELDIVTQYTTGNGTNPQDILPLSHDLAFISLFEMPHLLMVEPLTGTLLATVDLSPFADEDGIPEAAQLIHWEDRVFVVCQRLDRNTPWMDPAGVGCLAVLHAVTGQPIDMDPSTPAVDPIWLPRANPTAVRREGADLFLACTGNWGHYDDGALVRVDLTTGIAEIVVEEEQAGGNIGGVEIHGQKAFLVVSYPDWSNAVVPYDFGSGAVGAALEGPSGGYVPSILIHDGLLYIADQGRWDAPELAGILMVDADDHHLVCGPVSAGLPPMSAAVVAPSAAVVPAGDRLVSLGPTPALAFLVVTLHAPCQNGRLALHDLSGRVVMEYPLTGSTTTVPLRQRLDGIAPGAYVARVSGRGLSWKGRVVLR